MKVEQRADYPELAKRYERAFEERRTGAREFLESGNPLPFRQAHDELERVRKQAAAGVNDTNYIFLGFVTRYLPAGVVGLIMAAIFAAAMSTISAEINSLATVSVIDIYKRFIAPGATDGHTLNASRVATVFWGIYAVVTAGFGRNLGSLIEAVNMLGSLFYGSLLGVFVLAFFCHRVRGTAAFTGVLAGQAVVFCLFEFTGISFLWYNVIGSLVVVTVGLMLSAASPKRGPAEYRESA